MYAWGGGGGGEWGGGELYSRPVAEAAVNSPVILWYASDTCREDAAELILWRPSPNPDIRSVL